MAETLSQKWSEETLTDNTKRKPCQQCKTCVYRDNGDVWSNHYTKASCQIYEYPDHKPVKVINNQEECEFYTEEE